MINFECLFCLRGNEYNNFITYLPHVSKGSANWAGFFSIPSLKSILHRGVRNTLKISFVFKKSFIIFVIKRNPMKTIPITVKITKEQLQKLDKIKKANSFETYPQTLRYLIENFKGK